MCSSDLDFSARIAYVDYNGTKVLQNYLNNEPKTSSERMEFVKNNAPKMVAGIEMIGRFFKNLKNESLHDLQTQQNRSEEHTSELQSQADLVCRLLLEKNKLSLHFIVRLSL